MEDKEKRIQELEACRQWHGKLRWKIEDRIHKLELIAWEHKHNEEMAEMEITKLKKELKWDLI